MKAHLGAHSYRYGDEAGEHESSVRFRHRFQWLAIRKVGRVVTWSEFEVIRVSRKVVLLIALVSLKAVFRAGIRLDKSRFSFAPRS